MLEKILDPDVLKSDCGLAAMLYGIATIAFLICVFIAKNPSLRNDSRFIAPILAVVAVALALIAVEFPRASQTLLPILYPSVTLALLFAGVALIILAIRVLKYRATRIAAPRSAAADGRQRRACTDFHHARALAVLLLEIRDGQPSVD